MPFISIIWCSSVAAVCTRLLTHPLDTVKTRIQLKSSTSSVRSTFKHIVKTEGFRSLYSGLGISLFFSVPALSCYLGFYEVTKQLLQPMTNSHLLVHALSAAVAEASSGLFWTPMEVLKNKLQSGQYQLSAFGLAKRIWNHQGIKGLYSGYFLGLAVFMPYTICYFSIYEHLKSKFGGELPFYGYTLCSGVSGAIAAGVSSGLDVVKTRVQVDSGSGRTFSSSISEMYNQDGIKAFTRGMGARVVWVVPSVMISMTIFETLKRSI